MEKEELSGKVMKIMRQLGDMPIVNTRTYQSKDRKYVINEVSIKTIKPTNYYKAIIDGKDTDFPYGANKKEGENNGRSH